LKSPTAILAKGGVMGYGVCQGKSNEPTVSDVYPDFFNQSPFRADSIKITDEQHLEQHDRINTGASIFFAVQWPAFLRNERKVDSFVDFP
jgi:hypothetical protein